MTLASQRSLAFCCAGLYHRKSEVLVRVEGGHDWSGHLVRVNLSANLLGVIRSIRPCINQVPGFKAREIQ